MVRPTYWLAGDRLQLLDSANWWWSTAFTEQTKWTVCDQIADQIFCLFEVMWRVEYSLLHIPHLRYIELRTSITQAWCDLNRAFVNYGLCSSYIIGYFMFTCSIKDPCLGGWILCMISMNTYSHLYIYVCWQVYVTVPVLCKLHWCDAYTRKYETWYESLHSRVL